MKTFPVVTVFNCSYWMEDLWWNVNICRLEKIYKKIYIKNIIMTSPVIRLLVAFVLQWDQR